jgi:hypothetical protein
LGKGLEAIEQGLWIVGDDRGAMVEVRAGRGERVGDIDELEVGMGREMRCRRSACARRAASVLADSSTGKAGGGAHAGSDLVAVGSVAGASRG